MSRDSNPQPCDRESSLLPIRPDFRPTILVVLNDENNYCLPKKPIRSYSKNYHFNKNQSEFVVRLLNRDILESKDSCC